MSINNEKKPNAEHKSVLRAEARRILSAFEGRPIGGNDIERDEKGRPFFPGREIDFNISHSARTSAVSYFSGGNGRTGCDIELVRPRSRMREITETFFSHDEKDYIFSQSEFYIKRFYEIWTLKECFIKLRGLSVFDISACPSFIDKDGAFNFCADVRAPLLFELYELSDGCAETYMLSAVLEGAWEPAQIRMFSHFSLTCKKNAEIKAAPN